MCHKLDQRLVMLSAQSLIFSPPPQFPSYSRALYEHSLPDIRPDCVVCQTVPQKWLTEELDVHLPSSCARRISPCVGSSLTLLLLLIVAHLLLIALLHISLTIHSLDQWPEIVGQTTVSSRLPWSIIVHLLMHLSSQYLIPSVN